MSRDAVVMLFIRTKTNLTLAQNWAMHVVSERVS